MGIWKTAAVDQLSVMWEEELLDTKYKLDKAEEKLSVVENKLQESESNVSRLIQSGMEIRFDLQDCLRKKDNLNNIYSNSYCFFRYPIQDNRTVKTNVGMIDKNFSGGR